MAVVSRSISAPSLLQPVSAAAPKSAQKIAVEAPDLAPKVALPTPTPLSGVKDPVQAAKPLPSIKMVNPWVGVDDIDLVREVLYYQREGRIVWWQNAGDGAAIGAGLGAVLSIPPTLIFGILSGGPGVALFPIITAGGATIGSSAGALGHFRGDARPDEVRKHIFWGLHVVETREQSAQLVAQLKDAGALSRTRHRRLLNLDAAATVFAHAGLSETQQLRANRILQIVAIEQERRAQLLEGSAQVHAELRALRHIRRWNRTPRDILRMEALADQVDAINCALKFTPAAAVRT